MRITFSKGDIPPRIGVDARDAMGITYYLDPLKKPVELAIPVVRGKVRQTDTGPASTKGAIAIRVKNNRVARLLLEKVVRIKITSFAMKC
jgi:hypothetical protein